MAASEAPLLPYMHRKPPFTVEVSGYPKVEGETIPRRSVKSPEKLLAQPEEGINTVLDILNVSAERYGRINAVGSRKLVRRYVEPKKVKKIVDGQVQEVDKLWTYFEMSEYSYLTYKEYRTLALQLGAGFRKLGLQKDDRVHLFAATSAHWLAISHGAMSQSMPIVTAYDTLGEDGLRASLSATKAKAIFLEPGLLRIFTKVLPSADAIQYVVYNTDSFDELLPEDLEALKRGKPGLKILSFEELRSLGEENPVVPTPPHANDLCCIMYTSGTGGSPKGVLLKHSNVVAAVAGATSVVMPSIHPGDGLLAYLPLAHIFELVFENSTIYWGGTLGYGNRRTLSDSSVRNCRGDIAEFRPTLLVGVPAVWETVKKGILSNVEHGSFLTQKIFWGAFYAKKFLIENGLPGHGLLDAIVFNKVKQATGGRLKFCMNGAAPLSKETHEFISFAITPMILGYGLTETSAMGALCDPLAWTSTACGEPPSCVEVKLVDFGEAGYFTNTTPPQGEILLRGPSVMDGYYENDEETKAVFTADRWYKTGDIGEWDTDGHLKIIDRKKNLVKTLNGEYIALEKLEAIYRSVPVVANICVYASITETNPIAIIEPAEPALKKLASNLGVECHGIGDLVHDKRIQTRVLKDMQAIGRKSGLVSFEIVQGVVLADEEWTPQNNLTTPTSKINRRALFERYKKDIELAYST